METVVVNAGSVPSEEQALAALTTAAETAPSTTEEALSKITTEKASSDTALPEKFKSTADLLKAYNELEAKLGAPKATEEAEVISEEKSEADTSEKDEIADDVEVTEDDVDETEDDDTPLTASEVVDYMSERFAEQDGTFTEEDYQLALDAGYDKATVDRFVANQVAANELSELRFNEAAGGKENLDAMLIWAATGLQAEEIVTFNAGLAEAGTAVKSISDLKAKYDAANGKAPVLISGKPAGAVTTAFGSWAEVTVAMSDKRYGPDKAYTAEVAAKIGRSAL